MRWTPKASVKQPGSDVGEEKKKNEPSHKKKKKKKVLRTEREREMTEK